MAITMNRKLTAWKKSRKFGDVYGGRKSPKITDKIFTRCHSLKPPGPNDSLPILVEDNPSKDFFFPLTGKEVEVALKALPKKDYSQITHIWLRRLKKSDYEKGDMPLAEFICGSGVRVIVLYPVPSDMMMELGEKKPSDRKLKELGKWCGDISNKNGSWRATWTLGELRKYFVGHLLYHEVGHHVDWYYRHWSKANLRKAEENADQYAIQKTATATHILNRLDNKREIEAT